MGPGMTLKFVNAVAFFSCRKDVLVVRVRSAHYVDKVVENCLVLFVYDSLLKFIFEVFKPKTPDCCLGRDLDKSPFR